MRPFAAHLSVLSARARIVGILIVALGSLLALATFAWAAQAPTPQVCFAPAEMRVLKNIRSPTTTFTATATSAEAAATRQGRRTASFTWDPLPTFCNDRPAQVQLRANGEIGAVERAEFFVFSGTPRGTTYIFDQYYSRQALGPTLWRGLNTGSLNSTSQTYRFEVPAWAVDAAPSLEIGLYFAQIGGTDDAAVVWRYDRVAQAPPTQCPLPDARRQQAAQAFGDMMQVAAHPRCANCHGAFEVTAQDLAGPHPGGYIALIEGTAYPRQECPTCHTAIGEADWRQPVFQRSFMWGGRGPASLCQALMVESGDELRGPSELLSHVRNDDLVGLGFHGWRGMDADSPEPPADADPPTLNQDEFVAAVMRWMQAMDVGASWPADAGRYCSCVSDPR